MELLVLFIIITPIITIAIIVVVVNDSEGKEEIMKTPNGKYFPTVGGQSLFITVSGSAEKFRDNLNQFNVFNSHKEAVDFLNKWKELRGIGAKPVGLDYKEEQN